MPRTYKVGPSGSFGARYGTVARKRYSTVINTLRQSRGCPQCHITAVHRMSVGIWMCGRCGFKFAGGAYSATTKLGEIAERAAKAGVARTLVAELRIKETEASKVKASRGRKKVERGPAERSTDATAASEDKPA